MLKRVEKIKLKSQLFILVCLSVCIIILLQIVYLSWFELITTRNYSEFLKDTLRQVELKAASFSKDINNIANIASFNDVTYQFINTQDIDDRLKLKNNMQVMIDSIMLSNKSINGIMITDLDMVNIGAYRREDFWILNEVKRLKREGRIHFGQPTHYILEGHESEKPFYVCVTNSFRSYDPDIEFITIVNYNADSLINIVSNIQPNDNSLITIVDTNHNIVASNRIELSDFETDRIRTAIAEGGEEETRSMKLFNGRDKSLVYQRSVSNLHWKVIGITPDVEIAKDLSELKQFGVLTGFLVIAVLLGFGLIINKSITSPIIRMAHFMKSIGQNYTTQRLDIHNENEISLLARLMNKMLDNIGDMTNEVVASKEKVYKAELAKKHAQFSAFQTQVNPHFLYNTLDCIRSIALSREVPEIFDITTSMAKIFRYSIKENNDVRVGDELGCIRDYFKIIQIRQSNRFTITYEIEEVIEDCIIPKMILQPIVENAVFHGLEQMRGQGNLLIRGYSSGGGAIIFEIVDDGRGMAPDVLESLRLSIAAWDPLEDKPMDLEKKSIGLINIDRRIKLLYGTHYGVSVDSSPQRGTSVTLTLPMGT